MPGKYFNLTHNREAHADILVGGGWRRCPRGGNRLRRRTVFWQRIQYQFDKARKKTAREERAKDSSVTDGKVTKGQPCHVKKLGFYLEECAL